MDIAHTRVLLVDDEPIDALLVQRSLCGSRRADGRFALQHATTLSKGIEQLDRNAVDVLLLDLQLPDSAGAATVARLRARDGRVPLVVLTGRDDPELVGRVFEAGADEFLAKRDLHAGLLRRTLRHAIERRRTRTSSGTDERASVCAERGGELLHDLKNLQTSILGNARILEREIRAEGFLRQRAAALLDAARLAADVVRRLCGDGESEEGKAEATDLTALVRRCEALLRAAVPEPISLRLVLADGLAPVVTAPESLRRVLLELVVNAVEAIGGDTGAIEVRTGSAALSAPECGALVLTGALEPGPHVWLEVRDDGAGFDRATLARLFERGFSTKGVGRGRGLVHVREMLEDAGAGLVVESRPSEGSTFRVLLRARR